MQLPDSLAERLLGWYAAGHRALPWRQDHEPYHVWLSEIMLQQTRVEAVKGYYARFLSELPDIAALAACEENRLTKLWEGLGYYSRVRNLQKAARVIMVQHGGAFPRKYAEIRALPGVGDYTAGAVASICFDVPEPAVDGNVLRVLSRVTQDTAPVTRPAVKKAYETALRPVYAANPGKRSELTQALMELGACVCVPNGAPKCDACPLRTVCLAEKSGAWASFPVKEAKKPRRIEEKTVFFLQCGGQYAVRKRPETGLLAGLWELPNVEGTLDAQQALALLDSWGLVPEELTRTRERTHIFTHVEWRMRCYDIRVSMPADSFTWVSGTRFQQDIALPTAFRIFWQPEDAE
mgnify:FL=1